MSAPEYAPIRFDCAPIELPGVGNEKWARLALIIGGITFFALAPLCIAFAGRGDPFKHARDRHNIQIIKYAGHSYAPAWWLEQAFPEARDTIRTWRVMALKMRAQTKIG